MKKILFILGLIFVLGISLPYISFGLILGNYAAPWTATSTSQGWIFPQRINSVEQTVVGNNYLATSTKANIFTGKVQTKNYFEIAPAVGDSAFFQIVNNILGIGNLTDDQTYIQFNADHSGVIGSALTPKITIVNASTTALSTATLCLTGDLPCRTSWPTSSGGSTDWTYYNGSGIHPATSTNTVLIGGSSGTVSTSTNATLEVWGDLAVINGTVTEYTAPLSLEAGTLTLAGQTKYSGKLSAGNTNYKGSEPAGTSVSNISNDGIFTLATPNTTTTFNNADLGTLKGYLNGTLFGSYNLAASFNETNRASTQTYTPATDASGMVRIDSVGIYGGIPSFQKGNATLISTSTTLRQGYNTIYAVRDLAVDQTSGTYEVFYDNDAGASPSVNTPTVSELVPVFKWLSGVKEYYRGSTFNGSVICSDCFDNVYNATSPLTYTWSSTVIPSGNITETDGAVTGLSNPPAVGETMTVTNKAFTVSSANNRATNTRFLVTPRDPYNSYSSGTSASANRIVDAYATTSTALSEPFDDEKYRVATSSADTIRSPIIDLWTGATALTNGNAQIYNGSLIYPTTNFSTGYLPTGSPNYSTFSGRQQYQRVFQDTTTPHSSVNLTLGNLIEANVGQVGSGNVNVEIKLSTQTGWLDAGCSYNAATFTGANGDCIKTSYSGAVWSLTFGSFTTANSGNQIEVKVSFLNSTNSITDMSVNW